MEKRNQAIFDAWMRDATTPQRVIALAYGISTSRVHQICDRERKKMIKLFGGFPELNWAYWERK